jgi:hypothetical protein
MNFFSKPTLACLFVAVALFACKKSHDVTPAPPVKPTDSTIHINYIYLASSFQMQTGKVTQIELIINEDSGKILLDTVAAVNTNIIADLKTTSTVVDLTVISFQAYNPAYSVDTYEGIHPAAWSVLPGSDSTIGSPPTVPFGAGAASLYYTHVPAQLQAQPYRWTSYADLIAGSFFNAGDDGLSLYGQLNEPAYLVFPNQAMYNFHQVTSTADTVDLSTMDTAVRVKFPRPAQYPVLTATLSGFVDSSNEQSKVVVSQFESGTDSIVGADLVYPGKKVFQKYEVNLIFTDFGNTSECIYSNDWCDTVDAHPILPDDSYYTLSSTQNNNFSVQFNRLAPGFYLTQWNATNIAWNLFTATDSAVLHPLSFLSSLKSKLLAGQSLNSMKLEAFDFYYLVGQNGLVPYSPGPLGDTYEPISANRPGVVFARFFH